MNASRAEVVETIAEVVRQRTPGWIMDERQHLEHDVGLDSLERMLLNSKIEERFGVRIDVDAYFEDNLGLVSNFVDFVMNHRLK